MSWGNAWGTRTWGGGAGSSVFRGDRLLLTDGSSVLLSDGVSLVLLNGSAVGSGTTITAGTIHERIHVVAVTVTVSSPYRLTPGFIPIT